MHELRRTQARTTGKHAQPALHQRAGNVANLQAQIWPKRTQQPLQGAAASQRLKFQRSAGGEALAAPIGPSQQRPFQT
jgi:hypothetical protein